ncbi:MAG: peptidylprolyl isomerase [Pseudomonadota bacterium]
MIVRKLSLPAAIGLALALTACERPESAGPGFQNAIPGTAVITVNGTTITQPVFESFASAQGLSPATAENREARQKLVKQLTDLELLAQDATRQKLDKDAELASSLLAQYYTTLAGASVQHYTQAHPLSEDQIKAAYEEWVKDLPKTEYHARHILVADEATAQSVLEKLKQGGDFAKLAAELSTDPSKSNGGDLGWFTPDQMVAPFAQAVTALSAGQTSPAPVKTDFGWHVVQLEETRPMAIPKLEESRDAVMNHANNKQVEDYLAELRKKAKIKTDDAIINGDKAVAPKT